MIEDQYHDLVICNKGGMAVFSIPLCELSVNGYICNVSLQGNEKVYVLKQENGKQHKLTDTAVREKIIEVLPEKDWDSFEVLPACRDQF